jgi:hypothetical protein
MHSISELMVPLSAVAPVTEHVLKVLLGKVLGHASEASQTHLVLLQHQTPASACWTANNSSAAKATTATAIIESRLLATR